MIYYLLTIVDDIKCVSTILALFAFIATVATSVIRIVNIDEDIGGIRHNAWNVTKETLEDFIHDNRWDYQTDFGDRDDETDDYDYQTDFYNGISTAMENYDEQEEDVGEL